MAPIPAAFDGAVAVMPATIAVRPIWWRIAETLSRYAYRISALNVVGEGAPSVEVNTTAR
jgi:hypothetical protein